MEHYITPDGPPLHAHARHLEKKQLEISKAKFAKMEEMGIIRHFNSLCSAAFRGVSEVSIETPFG